MRKFIWDSTLLQTQGCKHCEQQRPWRRSLFDYRFSIREHSDFRFLPLFHLLGFSGTKGKENGQTLEILSEMIHSIP
jgi:hypothetical protein